MPMPERDSQIRAAFDAIEQTLRETRERVEQLPDSAHSGAARAELLQLSDYIYRNAGKFFPLPKPPSSADHPDRRRPRDPRGPSPTPVRPRNPSHLSGGAAASVPRDD